MNDEENSWTIDALAAKTGVPSRTIRFYQSKGVLPKPEKRGRVAYYEASHVERLSLIASLMDRGLQISAIRALLTRVDRGEVDLAKWLGLEATLGESWSDDGPKMMSEAELRERVGSDRPGLIADVVRLGLARREGEALLVRSPALLATAMRLENAGVELDTAVKAEDLLRKHLRRAATGLSKMFVEAAGDGRVRPPADGEWGSLLEALRPSSIDAVRAVFSQEMERALRDVIESGRLTKVKPKRRKKKRRSR